MPASAVKILSDAVARALASEDDVESLISQGVEPGYGSPAELAAFLTADMARWNKLVRESGIKPQ